MLSMVKGDFSFQIAHSVRKGICIISKSTLLPFASLSKTVQFQILCIDYFDANILIYILQISPFLEVAVVQKTEHASQYPGVYLYTTAGRMMRPVFNLKHGAVEYIGMWLCCNLTCDWLIAWCVQYLLFIRYIHPVYEIKHHHHVI